MEKASLKAADPIVELFPRYVPNASDDSVVAYANLMVSELKSMDQQNPDACYAFLFPHSSGGPGLATRYMDEKYKRDALDVLANIVVSAVENPQPKPDKEKAEGVLQPIWVSMAAQYGKDVALVNTSNLDGTGRKKVCEITASMFEEISALPKPQASLALRYLFSKDN